MRYRTHVQKAYKNKCLLMFLRSVVEVRARSLEDLESYLLVSLKCFNMRVRTLFILRESERE